MPLTVDNSEVRHRRAMMALVDHAPDAACELKAEIDAFLRKNGGNK
jgi:hypothetical protein